MVGIFGRAIDMKGNFSLPKPPSQPQGRDGKFPAHPRRHRQTRRRKLVQRAVRQGRSVGIRLTVMRKPQAIMSATVRRTKKASRAGCCPRSECVATMAASPRVSPGMMTACGADRGELDHTASHKLSSRRRVSRLHQRRPQTSSECEPRGNPGVGRSGSSFTSASTEPRSRRWSRPQVDRARNDQDRAALARPCPTALKMKSFRELQRLPADFARERLRQRIPFGLRRALSHRESGGQRADIPWPDAALYR
jgi:hypothetical protein